MHFPSVGVLAQQEYSPDKADRKAGEVQNAIHTELKDLVKNSVEETLNAMLDAEADRLVNAERYARDFKLQ